VVEEEFHNDDELPHLWVKILLQLPLHLELVVSVS
jgi:hypothetical protein